MTREPIDDATIEQLVRDVASGWTMPAVRLDAPSWRDRVRSPRARRVEGVRTWLGRAGRAAGAAAALTVAGAMIAALITRPPSVPGKSSEPTGRGTGPAPSAAAATPLPKLFVSGEAPAPTSLLMALEEGDFTVVELATGTGGTGLTGAGYGSAIRRDSDGTYLCLCLRLSDFVDGQATRAAISVERYADSGERLSSRPAVTLAGEPDPRDGIIPERPPHVAVDLRFSADGHLGFIGWSVRKHPVWQSGITTIDLGDGSQVGRIELPDASTGEGVTRRVVTAPRLLGGGADGPVAIAREWYSWSPPESEGMNYLQDTDVFGAKVAGGRLSDAATLPSAAGCGERVLLGGSTGAGRSWLACLRPFTNALVLRRFDADGAAAGATTFGLPTGIDGDPLAISPDGRSLFAWNALTATLARIDLDTGEKTEAQSPGPTADRSPLAAVGGWLAPIAAAKSFLYGGLVLSADGSRAYAIGVDGAEERGISGSSGVHVFDTGAMTGIAHWDATADFISLAVSGDGRFLYAAGMPRVDAAGESVPGQQASVTVFDTADGSVRVIAGGLGGRFLTFPDAIVR